MDTEGAGPTLLRPCKEQPRWLDSQFCIVILVFIFQNSIFLHSGVGAKEAAAVSHCVWLETESQDLWGGWGKKFSSRFSGDRGSSHRRIWLKGGRD